MSEHAELAPSSAERIVLCAGSVRMVRAMGPQEDTQDTREGQAVHWAGSMLLEGYGPICEGLVCEDSGIVLNVEMVEAAEMYANAIMARGPVGKVEERCDAARPLHPKNWGTPDHWFYDHMARTLYVDDLKYGHRFVDVFRNWQLVNYAALILASLGIHHEPIRVVFTIFQPRSYHRQGPIRSWATDTAQLWPLWDQLRAAFHAAMQPNAKVTPSPAACRDCPARHDCPGSVAAGNIAVDIAYESEPLHMTPAALAREYSRLLAAESFIKDRREGIAQRVMQTIARKQSVPGFMVDFRPGRTVFKDDALANGFDHVAAAYGVRDVVKRELITPTQAIKAGVPEHVVKLFSIKRSGAAELVEDDGSQAARVFNVKE